MRIVVLGGSGNFGARICRSLARDPALEVIAASRSARGGIDGVGQARLDLASDDFPAALKDLAPGIVVHTAGPFQGQDYRVAHAALDAGAHYIDLADACSFVAGFPEAVGEAASAAGLLAVSGASSLPGLSSAVVDRLSERFVALDEIRSVIAPGQRAQVGAATVAGTLSYAGRPFELLRDGEWRTAWGWQELRRVRLPGLRPRWSAVCAVPDLVLFPQRYPGVRTVEFRAALEVGIQHFGIRSIAAVRRLGVPVPIDRIAGPLTRMATLFDAFGGELGGMMISVTGSREDGSRACAEWSLAVDAVSGPEIPSMPSALLAAKIAHGKISERGAFPCVGFLTLEDFAPEFERWGAKTAIEEREA